MSRLAVAEHVWISRVVQDADLNLFARIMGEGERIRGWLFGRWTKGDTSFAFRQVSGIYRGLVAHDTDAEILVL